MQLQLLSLLLRWCWKRDFLSKTACDTLQHICRHLTGLLFVVAILQFRVFVIQTYCVNFSNVTYIRIILTRNIKCTTYDEPSKVIKYEVLFASFYFLASFWCCHFWCPTYQLHLTLNFTHCFKGNTTFLVFNYLTLWNLASLYLSQVKLCQQNLTQSNYCSLFEIFGFFEFPPEFNLLFIIVMLNHLTFL